MIAHQLWLSRGYAGCTIVEAADACSRFDELGKKASPEINALEATDS
jgi:hypothetical protein